jgi:hypothetical protein
MPSTCCRAWMCGSRPSPELALEPAARWILVAGATAEVAWCQTTMAWYCTHSPCLPASHLATKQDCRPRHNLKDCTTRCVDDMAAANSPHTTTQSRVAKIPPRNHGNNFTQATHRVFMTCESTATAAAADLQIAQHRIQVLENERHEADEKYKTRSGMVATLSHEVSQCRAVSVVVHVAVLVPCRCERHFMP